MTPSPARLKDFRQRISWREVEQAESCWERILLGCVEEDLGKPITSKPWQEDLTSSLCSLQGNGTAQLVAREPLVLCGIQLPNLLLDKFSCHDLNFIPNGKDGEPYQAGNNLGTLRGSIPQLLAVERTLLNFLQHLSGIATHAADFVKVTQPENVCLLDTRKTTPGLRILEKYATACGGSYNHRMGLFDRALIKDNHLAAAGIEGSKALVNFIQAVRKRAKEKLIELEIDDLDQLECAISGGVDAVLLDNFTPQEVAQAVEINQNRVVLEASGCINRGNLIEYAKAKPHFISTGAPVHSAKWVDIGLDWIK
ncbi:MAG: carboxylating nicotinate-nucleotide diphosphorylase [Opitutales bacterium]|nr:carboxylating nicotinate-nucleotide diphosphorylase [Opitutales bacterium]